MNENLNIAPFYVGQKVVGSGKVPKSRIIKGHPYVIRTCRLEINPVNGLGPFWYVGVYEVPDHDYMAPYLFVPIEEAKLPLMTFSEIKEAEKKEVLILN